MKRLPNGILDELSDVTGLTTKYLSDLVSTRKRPGRNRALELQKASEQIGKHIPAMVWLYGDRSELKGALAGQQA